MSVGQFFLAQLAATPESATVLGDRCYPARRPQGAALPCSVYEVISTVRRSAMVAETGLVRARVQVTFYALTYDGVVAAQRAGQDAWLRAHGTIGGVDVIDVMIDNEQSLYEDGTDEFAQAVDYIVEYREG